MEDTFAACIDELREAKAHIKKLKEMLVDAEVDKLMAARLKTTVDDRAYILTQIERQLKEAPCKHKTKNGCRYGFGMCNGHYYECEKYEEAK